MKDDLRSNLGVALHTGLRKGCDSTLASLAHAIINLTEEGWGLYLEHAVKQLEALTGNPTPEVIVQALQTANELFYGDRKSIETCTDRVRASQEVQALYLAFKVMSDHEWYGMSCYLPALLEREEEHK